MKERGEWCDQSGFMGINVCELFPIGEGDLGGSGCSFAPSSPLSAPSRPNRSYSLALATAGGVTGGAAPGGRRRFLAGGVGGYSLIVVARESLLVGPEPVISAAVLPVDP